MAKNTQFDYTAHAVAKDGSVSRWSSLGVAFINEKPDDDGVVRQSVTLKLNPGLSIHTTECDIVLLAYAPKPDAKP